MRIHSTAKLAPVTTLEERRQATLKTLQQRGRLWAYNYLWVVNPRRNDEDYLGISSESLVRNQDYSMTADEAAEMAETY